MTRMLAGSMACLGVTLLVCASQPVNAPAVFSQQIDTNTFAKALENLSDRDAQMSARAKQDLVQSGLTKVDKLKAISKQLNEILANHEDLTSPERRKAVAAIGYFGKLGAADYVARALSSDDDSVLISASKALFQLSDKRILPQVLDALERKNNKFFAGGSESATVRMMLMESLIQTAGKFAGTTYVVDPLDKAAVVNVIQDARTR